MAIRLTKENDHVQYGTTNFVADADADITSLPTKVTPGSECFCIETSTTYILNNQEEWKVKSQGGGGGSSSYQEKTVTPDFSEGDVSVTADRRYDALSEVTIQKDSNLIAGNIKKDVTVHGITGSYEGGESSDVTKLKSYLARSVTTIDDDILEEIGSSAFMSYSNLTSAKFDNVVTIGNNAFRNCTELITVNFSKLTTLADSIFYNCTKLKNVSIPNAVDTQSSCFYNCSELESISFPDVENAAPNMFRGCAKLTNVNMPKLKWINQFSFGWTGITSFSSDTANKIGSNAFQNCIELLSVSLPELNSYSGGNIDSSYIFSGCMKLNNVNLPKLPTVYGYMFQQCQNITILDFPSVTSIRNRAFNSCINLSTLVLRSDAVVNLYSSDVFLNTPFLDNVTTATLYVPEELITSYENNSRWSQILAHEGTTIQKIEGSPYENP